MRYKFRNVSLEQRIKKKKAQTDPLEKRMDKGKTDPSSSVAQRVFLTLSASGNSAELFLPSRCVCILFVKTAYV